MTPAEKGRLSTGIVEVAEHMIYPQDKPRFEELLDLERLRRLFAEGKECVLAEVRKLWTDGQYHWSSLMLFPVREEELKDEIFLCFIMDIGDKKHADEIEAQNRLLRQQELDNERYRIIVEQTGAYVFEWNRVQGYYCSEELLENLCIRKTRSGRIVGLFNMCHPDDREHMKVFRSSLKQKKGYIETRLRLKDHNQNYLWYRVAVTSVLDKDGKVDRIIGTVTNIDEAVRAEETLLYRAEYDMLTGIYNIQAFYIQAEKLIYKVPRRKYAIIRMDINRFKLINDVYGREEGNRLLCYVANILRKKMKKDACYGRLSGDVFYVCTAFSKEEELIEVIDSIEKELTGYGMGYRVTCSFGICQVPDRKVPVSSLCDWANIAQKTVKGNMVRRYAFYDDKLRAKQLEERKIESEMEEALENGEFVVWFQPKYNLKTLKIVGA